MSKDESWRKPHQYKIGGVPVSFPVKAYPSQMAMMAKIINSLQKGRNCLLESPTGSGKSLALLCAALAWQKEEIERVKEYNNAVEQGVIEPEEVPLDPNDPDDQDDQDLGLDTGAGFYVPNNPTAFRDADDDDFLPDNIDRTNERVIEPSDKPTEEQKQPKTNNVGTKKIFKKRIPRIYFGTRTHKQITQIIRELKKTDYSHVRMSILGSREHTCIEKNVSAMKNKNEGCKEKLEHDGCIYKQNVKKVADHYAFNAYRGKTGAWDMEEMVKVGKKLRCCPYFTVRELKNKANIVFCPYNYLVEPGIRNSMDIHLKNNIVILDEAHNIEDSARGAASYDMTQAAIKEAMTDLENMMKFSQETNRGGNPQEYAELNQFLSLVSNWIDEARGDLTDTTCQLFNDYGSTSRVWSGTNAVAKFIHFGFGPDTYKRYATLYEKAHSEAMERIAAEKEDRDFGDEGASAKSPSVHANTWGLLEGLVTVLGYLYEKDQKFRDDFKVALVKTQDFGSKKGGGKGGWQSKRSSLSVLDYAYSAHFWCLNPAVIFDDLKETVRSIVLTSGTLSPMASFSSELNVEFPIQLEANHVIDKKQVWIGTLSHGPSGIELKATYEHTESYAFQDEIGKLTLGVCNTISHGVLLFLPSYKLLNKLVERWQSTGLWNQLNQRKVVISEPRFSDEFEASIRHFNEVIEATNAKSDNGVDGALFIAVCRGKVSEGLDFADNNARAVICLGIPFPNIKDAQVKLKMTYNDKKNSNNKTFLNGKAWYEIQAFRALNQALGRCIRHRKDWGAILMVDLRYGTIKRYVNSLSKWVRNGVNHHNNYHDVLNELSVFKTEMAELDYKPEVIPESPSMNPEVKKVDTKNSSKLQSLKNKFAMKKPLSEWASVKPNVKEEVVKEPQVKKFKFEPVQAEECSGTSSQSSGWLNTATAKSATQNSQKPRRAGFNAPKKTPVFYGDSDDDFQ